MRIKTQPTGTASSSDTQAAGPKGSGRDSISKVFGVPWVYLVIPALAIGCGICLLIFWVKDGFP
jgi:hypothetical protein